MNVTPWLECFLACLGRAIDAAQTALRSVLDKAKFWERIRGVAMNDRQRLVLNKLLQGSERKLTATQRLQSLVDGMEGFEAASTVRCWCQDANGGAVENGGREPQIRSVIGVEIGAEENAWRY